MPFPEFDPDRTKVLFFSRGRGRGHAIPGMELARRLSAMRRDLQFRFVSYGTGAQTLEEFGYPLIDVGLPEKNGSAETMVVAGKLIGWLRPDIVIAHEEFAALPAAKIFDTPAVFITDWFADPNAFSMHALLFADLIIFTGQRGQFPEPEWVRRKVKYVGPVVRSFEYSRRDRLRARHELGLPAGATVVSVFPGSWTEAVSPIYNLVIAAFDKLGVNSKHLLWLAGDDYSLIKRNTRGRANVTIVQQDWAVDRLMAASNLAITKGSRNVSAELAVIGVHAIAISHGLNTMDDLRTQPLAAADLTPAKLSRLMAKALKQCPAKPRVPGGAAKAASAILSHIENGIRLP